MGWVTRAMIKILTISLGISPFVAVGICFVITVAYAVAAGLWAVLWTDLIQFVIKMSAVIVLAIYSVRAVGGMDALIAGVTKHFGSEAAALSVLPVRVTPNGLEAYAWMPLLALSVFLSMQWWAAYYPGANPAVAATSRSASSRQRRSATACWPRSSSRSAHYALRPWPWIVTGLATVILYPTLQDKEAGYVHAFVDLLPTPWRGLHARGLCGCLHVDDRDASELGCVVPRERLLQAVHPEGRDPEALRERRTIGDDLPVPRFRGCHIAAHVGRESVGVPARDGRRHGSRPDSPLVLVADQRVERDQCDGRVVSRVARVHAHHSAAFSGR
jgi:hypothetical protein